MNPTNENNSKQSLVVICKKCEDLKVTFRDIGSLGLSCSSESTESKCFTWLEQCTISSDGESVYSSETSWMNTTSSSLLDTTQVDDSEVADYENADCKDKVVYKKREEDNSTVGKLFNKSNRYVNLFIKKCRKVHLDRITKTFDSIYDTRTLTKANTQSVTHKKTVVKASVLPRREPVNIIDTKTWLAQPPAGEKQYLQTPAKFVIICHTATKDSFIQSKNFELVRLIQTLHIKNRKWNDIAYNFLVGSDGNVYEGRGWSVVSADSLGYNRIGVGIAFVGCFIEKLPPKVAIKRAKALITHGLEIGAIDEDYALVGHCQCFPTESPGKRLFDEIKTWNRWENLLDDEDPYLL